MHQSGFMTCVDSRYPSYAPQGSTIYAVILLCECFSPHQSSLANFELNRRLLHWVCHPSCIIWLADACSRLFIANTLGTGALSAGVSTLFVGLAEEPQALQDKGQLPTPLDRPFLTSLTDPKLWNVIVQTYPHVLNPV